MTAIQVAAIGAAVVAGRSSQRRKVADLQAELGVARTGQENLESQLHEALSELAAWQDEAGAAEGGQNLDAERYEGLKAAAALAEQRVVEQDQEIEGLKSDIASLEGQLEAVRRDEADSADAGQGLDAEQYRVLKEAARLAEQRVVEQDRKIKKLKNRIASLEGQLESAPADLWLEQEESEVLERDLELAKTDVDERVSDATGKVMHLEAEITDLEEKLDRADKIDQTQKSAIDRLSRGLEDARAKAKDLAGAEERAKKAEDDGVDLLEQLEQAQQRAQKADELEGELAQTSTHIEVANQAKNQLALEMKRQKTQHAAEKEELQAQRDNAKEEARKAKEERDIPEATKAEMKEKDEKISHLEDCIDVLGGEIKGKDKEVEKSNNRLSAAERRAERAERAAKGLRDERDKLQGEVDDLRKTMTVHDQNMRILQLEGGATAKPDTPLMTPGPIAADGIREAIQQARPRLDRVAIPESAMQHIEALDRESREGWREKVLSELWALNEYATDRGDFPGNYHQWVQQGMSKASAIGAKNVAMKDSETTAAGKSTSEARMFKIDPKVTGDSWMQMEAHLKFGTGTPNAPRIYFHDDTRGSTGKVHVGFIGPHSKVPTSGGF